MKRPVLSFVIFSLIAASAPMMVWSAKPEATRHYFRTGKALHTKARKLSSRQRNAYCQRSCKKTGGRRKDDVGACMEGCVFG